MDFLPQSNSLPIQRNDLKEKIRCTVLHNSAPETHSCFSIIFTSFTTSLQASRQKGRILPSEHSVDLTRDRK